MNHGTLLTREQWAVALALTGATANRPTTRLRVTQPTPRQGAADGEAASQQSTQRVTDHRLPHRCRSRHESVACGADYLPPHWTTKHELQTLRRGVMQLVRDLGYPVRTGSATTVRSCSHTPLIPKRWTTQTGDITFECASGETVEIIALQGAALQACYDTNTCTHNQTGGTLRERRLVQRRRRVLRLWFGSRRV